MMQKAVFFLSVLLIPVISIAQEATKTTQNTDHPNLDYKQMGAPMPNLVFMDYQDTTAANRPIEKKKKRRKKAVPKADTSSANNYLPVTGNDLDNNANLLIMMFNPTCGHCEDVAFMMEKNIDAFKKTKVVLLANKIMMPYIPDFAERHHIGKYPAMYIGYDSAGFTDKVFLYQSLPQINIYNGKRKLIKTYCGEMPIDSLKKYIE